MKTRAVVSLFAGLACCVWATGADAGNLESYFLGNEAAMTGGAVLSVTSDAGATWYNPAGLGNIDRDGVEVNASAFVLQILRVPGLIATESDMGDQTADGNETQLRSVPTALMMTRRIGQRLTVGFGVFVPMSEEDEAEADFDGDGASGVRPGRLVMNIRREYEAYYAGGSIGWGVTDRLRLGWSLFLVYYTGLWDIGLTAGIGTVSGEPFDHLTNTRQARFEGRRVGLQGAFGLQWEPVDRLHLGFSLRSPLLQVFQHTDEYLEHSVGGPDATAPSMVIIKEEKSRWGFEQVFPVQVEVGLAYAFDGGWVSAEVSLRPPLDSPSVGAETDFLWNARVGARFRLSDTVSIGTGFFTDRDPHGRDDAWGDFEVDFYGVALGAEFRTPHALVDDPTPDALVFSTTVGLRYGVGLGQLGGVVFDVDSELGFVGERTVYRDAIVHELTLHLGSSVLF